MHMYMYVVMLLQLIGIVGTCSHLMRNEYPRERMPTPP